MTIPIHVNNAQTTLGSAYTAGGNTLVMATGYGTTLAAKLTALGLTLNAFNPLRVTAIKSTALNIYGQITDLTKLTIFEVTGRSSDTLTGVSVVEGTTDQNFAAGDTLAFLWTAGAAQELRDAIVGVAAVALDDLTDVTITSAAANNVLAYNGSAWVNAAVPTHTHAASAITSGTIDTARLGSGTASNTTYLRGDQTWATISVVASLDDLSDVTITTPASGNVLSYNGSAWVNGAVPSHEHAASDITSGTIGTARLGSGTADNTTYLRGDQTWATVSGGGGTPGGSSGDVQYNDGGSFGGFWGFDGTTLTVDSGDRIAFTSTSGEFVRLGSTRFLHGGADPFNSSVYLGLSAGLAASTAIETVAIGAEALANEASHSSNVAVGAYAMEKSTNVSSSVALGRGALNAIGTTGASSLCIGIGYNTMAALTSGTGVIGIGSVLASATTITRSVAIGSGVGPSATSSANNVAIGAGTFAAATAPEVSVAIGSDALSGATTTAYGTVSIGYLSGAIPTHQEKCTFVGGYTAGFSPAASSLTKSIAIGWNAQPTADNMAVIGGTGTDAVALVVNGTTTTSQAQITATAGSKPVLTLKSGATPSGNQFQWLDSSDVAQAFVSQAFIISSRNGFKVTTTSGYYEGSNASNYLYWGGGGPNTLFTPINAAHVGVCVKAISSQSANLMEWQTSGGSVGVAVNKAAYLYTAKTSAPADGDIAAGQAFFWFDSTNGAAKLMVKGKSADGTVVSGEVALS